LFLCFVAVTKTQTAAPEAIACDQTRGGILDRNSPWVLVKGDGADEGLDHYNLQALSAWAPVRNSEYCFRWELENQSPNSPVTSGPTVIKNAWWQDVSLWKGRLEPGSGLKRASTWKQREYSSTPIDQDTDVTGGISSTFKLKAFLPRIKQASNNAFGAPPEERVAVSRNRFADIATGYAEGEMVVTVRSSARSEKEAILFGLSIDGTISNISFPFAQTIRKAASLDDFSAPLDYNPIEVPFGRREFRLAASQLQERSFFIVKQPLMLEGAWGRACLLVSVYSPVQTSFGRAACK
jgi:hypothetical protein